MRDIEILVKRMDATFTHGAAVVSISDNSNDQSEPPDGCFAFMRLHFHDIEADTDMFSPSVHFVAFTEKQAEEVATFIKRLHGGPKIRSLVFQCNAGISRSAGMAAAVARHFGRDDMPFFEQYLPNRLVYRLTLEAMRKFG